MEPIKTAPMDGTEITVKTAGGKTFRASWSWGFVVDEDEKDCEAWVAAHKGDHPPCWHDGICWASNEDLKPSDPPVEWMN